ncbi:hypothetical protein LTR37_001451 [Vermiconidia calcicola]|uniref:Uncharacterized protein n=1 Tax=Vermiconidia calcicola TaxID=1690605 RepID=A0ACC3NW58_9PEZI|nr:hypothetical protein LTR37_001451 [Vermiconidia calcicola]
MSPSSGVVARDNTTGLQYMFFLPDSGNHFAVPEAVGADNQVLPHQATPVQKLKDGLEEAVEGKMVHKQDWGAGEFVSRVITSGRG